jgi:hypothetical protein
LVTAADHRRNQTCDKRIISGKGTIGNTPFIGGIFAIAIVPTKVVTIYKTSKIEKYWKKP